MNAVAEKSQTELLTRMTTKASLIFRMGGTANSRRRGYDNAQAALLHKSLLRPRWLLPFLHPLLLLHMLLLQLLGLLLMPLLHLLSLGLVGISPLHPLVLLILSLLEFLPFLFLLREQPLLFLLVFAIAIGFGGVRRSGTLEWRKISGVDGGSSRAATRLGPAAVASRGMVRPSGCACGHD